MFTICLLKILFIPQITLGYVTCILDDAKVYANHAKKKTIDLEDVKISTQLLLDKAFTTPPPRDVLLELARAKNNTPLPLIKPHCGLRLPPDRYCLSACNYKLRAATQLKKMKKPPIDSLLARPFKATIKTEKPMAVKRPLVGSVNSSATGAATTNTTTLKTIAAVPKPLFKFSTASQVKPKSETDNIKMEIEIDENMKRKREEDEFEIV